MARSQLQSSPFVYTDQFKVDFPGGTIEPGAAQEYIEESASQNYILGMRGYITGDERVYRYAEASAVALAAGVLVSPDLSITSVVDTDAAVDGAEAIGQTEILMDNGAFSASIADAYAGGIFGISDDDGKGHGYPIQSNTAFANTDEVTLTLNRPIRAALVAANTDSFIMPNLFKETVVADATDPIISGVTPLAITADYFYWAQRRGRAVILCDVAAAPGNTVTLSDGTPGAVQLKDAETEPYVGFCIIAGDITGYSGVYLTLE